MAAILHSKLKEPLLPRNVKTQFNVTWVLAEFVYNENCVGVNSLMSIAIFYSVISLGGSKVETVDSEIMNL